MTVNIVVGLFKDSCDVSGGVDGGVSGTVNDGMNGGVNW